MRNREREENMGGSAEEREIQWDCNACFSNSNDYLNISVI